MYLLTAYCVKMTWNVLMVWPQQTDVLLNVFRVLKMSEQIEHIGQIKKCCWS